MSICYLNGEFLPLEEAKISVLDRGFIFGDGVYEVMPVFNGRPFRLGEHLQRLANSLEAIGIADPFTEAEWTALLTTLIARNGAGDQSLYLQITRGVAKRDHVLSIPVAPTVFAMATRLETPHVPVPVSAISCEDIRWKLCHIKAIALLPNVLLRQQAAVAGAYEAILIRQGQLTEGSASNVFIVSAGVVKTPPKSSVILSGITRDLVLELLAQSDVPWCETPITESELKQAEEIWLTSSSREILPVIELDHAPVGLGKPGPIWQRIFALYQEYKAAGFDTLKKVAS
jgi:D-alanine transaminase